MNSEQYERIGQLFHAALELPREQRAAFLSGACRADADLRAEVESLLTAHDNAGDFVAGPGTNVAAWLTRPEELDDLDTITGKVGAYEVLSLIGRGGMGEVYLAHDPRLGRQVALKLLRAGLTHNQDAVRRFEQEARAASSLNHPNIITIYEIGDLLERRFMAMEFVEGQSLAAMIGRPFDTLTLARIGAQLARALSVAHAAGIVHRDVKPENVMVRADGYVKVLDFGLARLAPVASVTRSDAADTSPNLLLGTPRYMSPEQARGETAVAASDVFSLGVVLYELATGAHPFESESTLATLHAITSTPAPAPRHWAPDLPPALERLLIEMLHKAATARPTAADVEAELAKLSTVVTSSATRPQSAARAAHRREPNLPSQRTALLGRSTELAAIKDMLLDARVRLMTLTGAGGTGKTRLAIQVAADLAPHVDGVSFVNLAPIADPGLVTSAVAGSLGVRESGDLPLVNAIAEHLRSLGRTLLVMDNFEQVSDGADQGVARRVPRSPSAGDQSRRAPDLRRAGIPGATARVAIPNRVVPAVGIDGVRIGRALRSAGGGGDAGLRAHAEERRRHRRNLSPPRRSAAGDRAGGRARQDSSAGRVARAH
jgi:serine/threonine protein kinase